MALDRLEWVAFRRLTDRLAGPAPAAPGQEEPSEGGAAPGYKYAELDQKTLGQAIRNVWLALEAALAGPPVWDHAPQSQSNILRQQMEALLDLLSRAGLEVDDADSRRRCREEVRSARRSRLPLVQGQIEMDGTLLAAEAPAPRPAELEQSAVEPMARSLDQVGYANLARFVSLRTPWGESIFLGMVEHFLRRALALPKGPAEDWRCLEVLGRLLEERASEMEAVLDKPDEGPQRVAETVERLYQLGLSRALQGDYQQATIHFTAALKLAPGDPGLYTQRGDAYRFQCEYERAIADYNVAVRLQPAGAAVLVSRAIAFHFSGDCERAIADCTKALETSPNHHGALRTRAAAYAERGAHDSALNDLSAAIIENPGDDEAHYLRGIIRAKKRDFDGALADLNRTVEQNPYHLQAYLHRGHVHRFRNDYAAAIRDYSEVLRHHPNNVPAFTGRGLAHKLRGDLDRAIADFSEAVRLDSTNAQAYYQRGVSYRSKGDLARAQADLEEAIRRQPDNWGAWYYRGKISLTHGQYSLAILDLTEAVHLNPKLVVAYLSRALAYDQLGQHAEGIADASEAIKLYPATPAACLVRGVLHAHKGDHPRAIADLNEAIRLDEGFALAYHERAMAFILQGDRDLALADCNRLIALEPRSAQAYVTRSVVLHSRGDIQQALTDYARALQIDPTCMVAGMSQSLAGTARSRATQRIADYIDGLRPEAPADEAPPPSEFQIVIKPPEPPKSSVSTPKALAPRKAPSPSAEQVAAQTQVHAQALKETVVIPVKVEPPAATVSPPERPQGYPPSNSGKRPQRKPAANPKPSQRSPEAEPPKIAEKIPAEPLEERKERPTKAEAPEQAEQPNSEASTAPDSPEQNVDALIDELLAGTPEAPTRPEASQTQGKEEPAAVEPGRRRTPKPKALSMPPLEEVAAALSPSNAPKRPVPKRLRADDDEDVGLFRKWLRPAPIGVTVAALVLLYFAFPSSLFQKPDRVAVFPVQGKAEIDGEPLPKATIFLHPVGDKNAKNARIPRPRATVHEDGTFVLGTYGADDGAPPGEYKVTVQLFYSDSPDRAPRNLLPVRYAKAETTDLLVRIQEGQNHCPIKLKY
jgi:tetratricopeptide (TPR) repeat protein